MTLEQIRCTDILADARRWDDQPEEIESLAESVRHFGVLRPVLLRETTEGYVIVHGERRWRAARLAGLDSIPAFIVQGLPVERPLAA